MKYAVIDLETTSKEVFGRTANYKYNQIVAYSTKTAEQQVVQYVNSDEDLDNLIGDIIQQDVLVAHNAKFECLYLWEYNEFQDWLKNGGQIYCTQLAEYYLSNYQTQWGSLRDIAVNKYGCKERTKWLDELLFKNKNSLYEDVNELPVDKVLEDVENDVKDTEVIYLKQQEAINARALQNTIKIQNDMLLATIEMEANGFAINKEVLQTNKEELKVELKECEDELNALIKRYWVIE